MASQKRVLKATLGSPLVLGLVGSGVLFSLLHTGLVGGQVLPRYCTSHPLEYVEVTLFFIGLAALGSRMLAVAAHRRAMAAVYLEPAAHGTQRLADCQGLVGQLERLPAWQRESLLGRRIADALEFLRRSGEIKGLDEELRYLADADAARQQNAGGLVRLCIWSIPILGLLTTLTSIASAAGAFSPQDWDASLPRIAAGLGGAFDTTASALALAMMLTFLQFFVQRSAVTLLDDVDRRAQRELIGRFEKLADGPAGQLMAVRKMVEVLLTSIDDLVRRQSEIWWAAVEKGQQRWDRMTELSGKQLQAALAGALEENLKTHARELLGHEEALAERNRHNWDRLEQALVRNTETVAALQKAVVQKAEVLGRASQTAEQLAHLEETLNRNLAALAGAKSFDQIVTRLAAAVDLLQGRLNDGTAGPSVISWESARRASKAA